MSGGKEKNKGRVELAAPQTSVPKLQPVSWRVKEVPSSDKKNPGSMAVIHTNGMFNNCTSPLLEGKKYEYARRKIKLICKVVTSCARLRDDWDIESSRHIIPLFNVAHEMADILRALKQDRQEHQSRGVDLQDEAHLWWKGLEKETKDAFKAINRFVKSDWEKAAKQALAKRAKEDIPAPSLAYVQADNIAWDHVVDEQGNVILYFSSFVADPAHALIQSFLRGQTIDKMSDERKETRAHRIAQWGVILETANAFMRLCEPEIGLPDDFADLVENMRIVYGDLCKLPAIIATKKPEETVALNRVIHTLHSAFDCFDAPAQRQVLARMPDETGSPVNGEARRMWGRLIPSFLGL